MATETVTVVFTDLVGSTELMSRVGEAKAEELRREHFGLLRAAVERHGGREIKNLGDGLMLVFGSAGDAVAAAAEIQVAFDRRNRKAADPLLLRIGVALGDADTEDGDYFGVPVVEAARLCAAADRAEILVTDLVRMLAGSRGGHEFESCGELELKGLDRPVAASRILWTPAETSVERPPLPPRIAASVAANFVGRADERERLDAAWKSVVAGERRMMFLAGEPGIGKTTLASQFASDVYDAGAIVVYGRCDEDLGIPYQPWIEALTQLIAAAPEEALAEHLEDRGAHLARLVPELTRRTGVEPQRSTEGDSDRFVLYGCVTDLLGRLSSGTPVLLVLDDLHWADPATVQLLRHIATADGVVRVGVLSTFRDSEIAADHPVADLLAALHREGDTERIALRGFGDDDLLRLLERNAGHEMDDTGVALRDAILEETAGNPFFVGEILRHLAETGAIYQDADGRWVGDVDVRSVGLPVSVREVIGRRVAALGVETERVLSLASVVGRDFDLSLVAVVADFDEDALIDLCDAAVAAAVLQETDDPDRYTFAHALIEHTLYDGLSPARRARAHRSVAEAIEARADAANRVGELAYHWTAAVQPTDTAKAIHYTKAAGDRALEQLAPDEASRWYAQALDLLDRSADDDPGVRADVLVGLGDAGFRSGVPGFREHLLEAGQIAIRIGDQQRLEDSIFANTRGWGSVVGTVDEERVAMLRAAIAGSDTGSPRRALMLAILASELYYSAEPEERLRLVDEAVAIARALGDPQVLVQVLYLGTVAVRSPATHAQRRAFLEEALPLVDEVHAPRAAWDVYDQTALTALECGDLETERTYRARGRAMEAKVPLASGRWTLKFHDATYQIVAGDLPAAESLAEGALQYGLEIGQPDAFAIYGAQLANIRLHQGRWDDVIPLIEQELVERPALAVYRPVLAWAHARHGAAAAAGALLDELEAGGPEAFPSDSSWTTAIAAWVEAAFLCRRSEIADVLYGAMAPFADLLVTTSVTIQPAVAHFLGRLDHLAQRYDDAENRYAAALRMAEGMRSPLLVTYTEAAWAELAVDRCDTDRARELAEAALAGAVPRGYGYIEHDARAVLDRLA